MAERFKGLIAAPPTPMREDGSLHLAVLEQQAAVVVDNGLAGVFVCGSTGEGLLMSTSERMEVAERWKQLLEGRLPILIHVGHHSLVEARVLAEHAERQVEAAGIASAAPSYFRPQRLKDLVEFCAEVASAAPRTPFYYYHQPANSGVRFAMADFVSLAIERIDSFAGLKFTDSDLADFGRCLDVAAGQVEILLGLDEVLLAGLALGADGAVGGTYNFAAPLYHRIVQAYQVGDMVTAQRYQALARQLVAVIDRYRGIPALKAAMKSIGIDCGPCRLPHRSLSEAEYERFVAELDELGLRQYFCNVGK